MTEEIYGEEDIPSPGCTRLLSKSLGELGLEHHPDVSSAATVHHVSPLDPSLHAMPQGYLVPCVCVCGGGGGGGGEEGGYTCLQHLVVFVITRTHY